MVEGAGGGGNSGWRREARVGGERARAEGRESVLGRSFKFLFEILQNVLVNTFVTFFQLNCEVEPGFCGNGRKTQFIV